MQHQQESDTNMKVDEQAPVKQESISSGAIKVWYRLVDIKGTFNGHIDCVEISTNFTILHFLSELQVKRKYLKDVEIEHINVYAPNQDLTKGNEVNLPSLGLSSVDPRATLDKVLKYDDAGEKKQFPLIVQLRPIVVQKAIETQNGNSVTEFDVRNWISSSFQVPTLPSQIDLQKATNLFSGKVNVAENSPWIVVAAFLYSNLHQIKKESSPRMVTKQTVVEQPNILKEDVTYPVEGEDKLDILSMKSASISDRNILAEFKANFKKRGNLLNFGSIIGVSGIGKTRLAMELALVSKRFVYLFGLDSLPYQNDISAVLRPLRDYFLSNQATMRSQERFEQISSSIIGAFIIVRCILHWILLEDDVNYSSQSWLLCQQSIRTYQILKSAWILAISSGAARFDSLETAPILENYMIEGSYLICDEANVLIREMSDSFLPTASHFARLNQSKLISNGRSLYSFFSRAFKSIIPVHTRKLFLGTAMSLENIELLRSSIGKDEYEPACFVKFPYLTPADVRNYVSSFFNLGDDIVKSVDFERCCYLLQGRPRFAAKWIQAIFQGKGTATERVFGGFLAVMSTFTADNSVASLRNPWRRNIFNSANSPEINLPGNVKLAQSLAREALYSSIFMAPGTIQLIGASMDEIDILGAQIFHISENNKVNVSDHNYAVYLTEPLALIAGWQVLSDQELGDPLLRPMKWLAEQIKSPLTHSSSRGFRFEQLVGLALLRLKGFGSNSCLLSNLLSYSPNGKDMQNWHFPPIHFPDGGLPLVLDGRTNASWSTYNTKKNPVELMSDLLRGTGCDMIHPLCVVFLPCTDFGPDAFTLIGDGKAIVAACKTKWSQGKYVAERTSIANLKTLENLEASEECSYIKLQIEMPRPSKSNSNDAQFKKLVKSKTCPFIAMGVDNSPESKLLFSDEVLNILGV